MAEAATVRASLQVSLTSSLAYTGGNYESSPLDSPGISSLMAFLSGSGAGKVGLLYAEQYTLAYNGNRVLNLKSLTDSLKRAVVFTKVRFIVVQNLQNGASPGVGSNSLILGGGSTPLVAFTNAQAPIRPGGLAVYNVGLVDATGYTVTAATAHLLKLTSGAEDAVNSLVYKIIIGGE